MSEVCALFIKGNKARFVRAHYKKVLESWNDDCREWVDGGWVVVDHDNKMIINCQSVFSPVLLKGYSVYNIPEGLNIS